MAEAFEASWQSEESTRRSTDARDLEAATESRKSKTRDDGKQSGTDPNVSRRRPWDEYQMGYPRFAAFIAEDKDKSSTIYRRFERLAARNLLYLESELAELEKKQDDLDDEYRLEPIESKVSLRSWKALRDEAPNAYYDMDGGPELAEVLEDRESDTDNDHGTALGSTNRKIPTKRSKRDRVKSTVGRRRSDNPKSRKRLLLALRIRNVLREYYEFMKLQSDILALSKPDRRSWKATRKIFKNYNPHTRTYRSEMIGGEMMSHLDNENKPDLCVLAPPIERDRLTKLLEGRLAWIFRKRTSQGSTYHVPEQRVKIFVTLFSIVAAAAFLIGAIVGLYVVKDPRSQLFMLGGFTIGFAGALGLLTNARRQDVFAATAAYAAVLVVFVSGSLSGNSGTGVPPIVSTVTTLTSLTTSTLQTTTTATSTLQTTSTITSLTTAIITTTTTFTVTGSSESASAIPASSSGLSTGSAVGIGIGAGAAVALTAMVLFVFLRNRRRLSRVNPLPVQDLQTSSKRVVEPAVPSGIQPILVLDPSPQAQTWSATTPTVYETSSRPTYELPSPYLSRI